MALKAGKGRAGARAAASHTGSLAGRHGAVQGAFARAGVVEAATSDEFFDSLQSLGAGRLVAGRSDAVLTISGGLGVLASGAAERLGLCLLPPGEATARRIRELAPEFAAGGVEAEVLQDVLFLLAPSATGDLNRAIARLHSDPRVVEVDVNPIVVRDGCTLVVDAFVVKVQ